MKRIITSFFILIAFTVSAQQPETDWLVGSWGVTYPVYGGARLDTEINNNGQDYQSGAQEIVDELPTVGHIITNLSYFANSHYFTLSANANIDVANEIHPSAVPSAANDQIIFDVLQTFKDANKKIILYISCNFFDRASADVQAAWQAYYTTHYDGTEYTSYKYLIQGFIENVKDYTDGYWLDTFGGMGTNGHDFVAMIKATDPGAVCGVNASKKYYSINGSTIQVDSDGINDDNEQDYKVVVHEPLTGTQDFTHGHVTPIAQKAPVNSWAYEEFTISNMVEDPYAIFNGASKLKHAWFPTRERWHLPQENLVFGLEQAYRFVRRIIESGASVSWATTTDPGPNAANASELGYVRAGYMMADEMFIMKEINRRLLMSRKMDYIPYVRPEGAYLVGETAPNYHQFIDFQKVDDKKVGDSDFFPFAYASSGDPVTLTSSNPSVATIVNNQISIQGEGTTDITASQSGNSTFAAATSKTQSLTVYPEGTILNNIELNGTATQSSDLSGGGGEASLAIDGDTNGVYANSSVTSTSLEIDPWWQVDLESDYSIDTIKLFGRTDVCCNTELSNFTVTITDNDGNVTYTETFTSYPDPSITINTGGVIGNIVKVQQHSSSVAVSLNLAEVQVSGNEINVSQTIFFPEIFDKEVGGANFSPKAMASSGLAVSYTSSNTDVAIIVNNDIQIVAEGTTNITATQLGNATFAAATPEVRQLNVIVPDEGGANENGEIFPEADSYTWDKFPDNNLNNNRLFIQQGAADSSRETFLKFNVSTLPESIDNITLQLTLDTEATAAIVCEAFLVTDDSWTETEITWNNIPASGVSLGTATHNGNVIEFDVTNSVLTESSGDGTISIKIVSTELGGTNYKIYSKETASSDLEKPKLIITETSLSNDSITLDDDTELSVYPNPMNDEFVIDLSSWQEASYTITNYTGQTLLSGVIKNGTASVDLSDLSSGFYVVRVSRDYETVSKKIIKK